MVKSAAQSALRDKFNHSESKDSKTPAVESGVPILPISQSSRLQGLNQRAQTGWDAGYIDSEHTNVAMMLEIEERTPHGFPSELRLTRIPHGPDGTIGFGARLRLHH